MSRNRKTIEDFIKEATAKHGTKYDYSKSKYKNYHTKLKILCPIHGEFLQSPANHFKGHGCMECGALFIGELNTYSIDAFISILFILCMASLILAFILLAAEIFIATRTINRNLIKTESIISKYR